MTSHPNTNQEDSANTSSHILCGNASDNLYLTFKGGCRQDLTYENAYRCTGCGGRFHKDCIFKHFELEKEHDWGRQEERRSLNNEERQRGIVDGLSAAWGFTAVYTDVGEIRKLISEDMQKAKTELDGLATLTDNTKGELKHE